MRADPQPDMLQLWAAPNTSLRTADTQKLCILKFHVKVDGASKHRKTHIGFYHDPKQAEEEHTGLFGNTLLTHLQLPQLRRGFRSA